jgi:hypothetical protein
MVWCGVLQCSGLASREFVCDVMARGRGSLVVCVKGLFRVSGRYWVGDIRWDVGKFMCVCVLRKFEGDRAIKLHTLSHLVGSLPLTISTMHGHMNIKLFIPLMLR